MISKVMNSKEPILLPFMPLVGISAGNAAEADHVQVWQQLGVTSDEHVFHSAIPGFCGELSRRAEAVGAPINLESANSILMRVRADRSAELWVDSVATCVDAIVKRPFEAGQPVFAADIADVLAVRFPAVEFQSTDGIFYLFRKSWRFGLYYDLRMTGVLDVSEMARHIGAIYRNLAFRHLYDTIGDAAAMGALTDAGWFPFIDIASEDFRALANGIRTGLGMDAAEASVVARYDDARIDRIKDRWLAHPLLGARQLVLSSALEAYRRGDYVSTVKIVLTEIEGILNDAHRKAFGSGARLSKLLQFVAKAGELKAGAPDTLLFPQPFRDFLTRNTFAQTDARMPGGAPGSRHTVGHGSAADDAYTRVRALQALLTMDQLVFFL